MHRRSRSGNKIKNLTLRQAKQILQQTEARAQAIAQQDVGRLASWAENKHAQKIEQERKTREKAEDEAKAANQKAKKAVTEAHNAEHTNQRTPDNRPSAKRRAGPSPPPQLPVIPPFPGEEASGSKDNPESQHEPKGPRGRPSNTKEPKEPKTKNKSEQKPAKEPDIKVDAKTKKTEAKAKAKAASVRQEPSTTKRPRHDTETINNVDPKFWEDQTLGLIKDQLGKRNFKGYKNPDGSRMKKEHYLAAVLKMITEGTWVIKKD